MFPAKGIVTFISTLVSPRLNSTPMLQIIFPFALIHGSINVFVSSRTICLIIGPEPIVNITIYMNELSFAVCPILTPLAHVFGAVGPSLFAKTISEATSPLARIDGLCFEHIRRPCFSRLIRLVKTLRHCFARFILSEILAGAHLF
jgi:ABC-type uncharacterized transport system permease subunit